MSPEAILALVKLLLSAIQEIASLVGAANAAKDVDAATAKATLDARLAALSGAAQALHSAIEANNAQVDAASAAAARMNAAG